MKFNLIKSVILFGLLCLCTTAMAERPMLIHSHNDYRRRVPFYQAYSQGVYSIEVDLFLHNGRLLIAHDPEDVEAGLTFEALYVNPIVEIFGRNGGHAWAGSDEHLQLLVELVTETAPTLDEVVKLLGRYPEVFDPSVNPDAVRVTITGRVPEPSDFARYPEWVNFDGEYGVEYTPEQLKRIALVSAHFRNYSTWNGKGSIVPSEQEALMKVVDYAHSIGKPVRFWDAPEGVTVYYTFYDLGIDYINTDRPEACAEFFRDFDNKTYCIGENRGTADGVTGFKRLDKTTRDFKGFRNDKLQLSQGIDIYTQIGRAHV